MRMRYAAEYSISFNASKSKYVVISPRRRRSIQYCECVAEGKPMEIVPLLRNIAERASP